MRYLWFTIAAAFLAAACTSTGRNFDRGSTALVLGQTTLAEATAAFGEPTERWTESANVETITVFDELKPRPASLKRAAVPGDFEQLRYAYTHATMIVLSDRTIGRLRMLKLSFWNDKLVHYHFLSSFPEDATNFDEKRVTSLTRGRTTRTDVLNHFGPPGGEGIYPHVARRGTRQYVYEYVIVGPKRGQRTLKHLELLFNAADRLEEVYLVTEERSGEGS
jgi:hypothetical protein